MKSIIIFTVVLCSLICQSSFAQDQLSIQRKGFVFGASLGAAATFLKYPEKSQIDIDLALDIKLGYMLKPNLALLLTSNVSVYDYSGYGRDRKRDFGILAPSVQWWFKNKFWILGGIGLGGDGPVLWDIQNPESDPLETKYYNGFGIITAVGYELYQKKNLALDIKVNLSYRNLNLQEGHSTGFSTGILIGNNFY